MFVPVLPCTHRAFDRDTDESNQQQFSAKVISTDLTDLRKEKYNSVPQFLVAALEIRNFEMSFFLLGKSTSKVTSAILTSLLEITRLGPWVVNRSLVKITT